jgi:hypothetical protein
MVPQVERSVVPLLTAPAAWLGSGPVVNMDRSNACAGYEGTSAAPA